MSTYDRQIDELRRHAEAQGWRYSRAANSHHQFYGPDKHTIVTFASTPSDHRGWLNSLSQMKQAGYLPPNGNYTPPTLGDQLRPPAQNGSDHTAAPTASKRTVPQLIEDYLAKQAPRSVDVNEIRMAVKAHRKDVSDISIGQEASRIASEGRIVRIGRGLYGSKQMLKEQAQEPSPPAPPAPPPAPVAAQPLSLSEVNDKLQMNLTKLDTALAALADISEVVQTTKAAVEQLIALRKALGG